MYINIHQQHSEKIPNILQISTKYTTNYQGNIHNITNYTPTNTKYTPTFQLYANKYQICSKYTQTCNKYQQNYEIYTKYIAVYQTNHICKWRFFLEFLLSFIYFFFVSFSLNPLVQISSSSKDTILTVFFS